jgi:glutamine synthetase
MLYYVIPKNRTTNELKKIINEKQIQFVSLMGVDLGGDTTDEKIPISYIFDNFEEFLRYGIQTDGSSVNLKDIATLNNARVDLVPDTNSIWFVDYNFEYIDDETGYPVGTLKIPAFLVHGGKMVGSRGVLVNTINIFKETVRELINSNYHLKEDLGIDKEDYLEEITLTSATEIEFWVKTPQDNPNVKALHTSQSLKEQYWKKTIGVVRTCLEIVIKELHKLGIEPEMGHKEVGGIESKIELSGRTVYAMEQLEIDFKYSNALQAADNEIMVREVINDVFRRHGLEVNFQAKPIDGVAGNGEHTHLGVSGKLSSGRVINLFSPKDMNSNFLSIIGFGAIMGLLKNYKLVNPFVAPSNDAFRRLVPGFEAPVCTVTSLGIDVENPSRNRSILAGLVRDANNPMATRFELRSPNPLSNTYLVMASAYSAMLHGIEAIGQSGLNPKELENIISKKQGEEVFYLEKNKCYRSELDVFENFTLEERNSLFGKPPATVWENVNTLLCEKDKSPLTSCGITQEIINSYCKGILEKWCTEIKNRELDNIIVNLRKYVKLHESTEYDTLDDRMWRSIVSFKDDLVKDTFNRKSMFSEIIQAIEEEEYEKVSLLYINITDTMKKIKELYNYYERNNCLTNTNMN